MHGNEFENVKHPKWKMFLYYAAFICLMLAGFLAVFSLRSKGAEAPQPSESSVVQVLDLQV